MSEPEGNEGSDQIYVACFVCENVIERKDGIYSAINIFDKFVVDVPDGIEVPESFTTPTVYCIGIFRSRLIPIGFTVKWRITSPKGKHVESPIQPLRILEHTSGHTSVFPITLRASVEGLYLIEVLVDDRVAGFTPLSIEHRASKTLSSGEDAKIADADQA